jgi:hypothetical protein
MNKELDAIDWSLLYSLKNVDVAVNLFNAKLKAIFDRHAPLTSKKVRGQQCPWISNEIRDQMNNRDYLLKRARRTKSPVDWDAYKSVRNACNITIRKSKQTHQRNLLSENRLNPRAFWQIIKNIFPTKSKEIASESLNLQKSDQANRFGTFFANAANSLKTKCISLTNFVWRKLPSVPLKTTMRFQLKYVSKIFVEKQLKSMKKKKATGLDGLPSVLLRDCSKTISKPLCFIINLSIT